MEYREAGRTGMKAGAVGIGMEHVDGRPYDEVKAVLDEGEKHGVNMIDLFMPGSEVRRHIGRALRGRRDRWLIQGHIGSVDLKQQYDISRDLPTCKRYFEDLLRFLGTDYIDFGMLFFIDSDEAFEKIHENGIVDYARQLKKQGTIRAIGASSHNPRVALKLVESGVIDTLMFSINPAFDLMKSGEDALEGLEKNFAGQAMPGTDPDRVRLYQTCAAKGVGISVMKTLGAGKLISQEHSPFGGPLTVGQCIHYALTRPAVFSVMVGCRTPQEVREAVAYFGLTPEQRDYSTIAASFEDGFKGHCVYCNHCQPCPVDIDIASVNRYLDIARLDEANIPPSITQHYTSLKSRGGACIACGSCEARCPFEVPVIERMEEAKRVFGS